MPKRCFSPPGNPILGHVLQIELRVPLIELLSGLLREVWRTACGSCAIDGRRERKVAARSVHEAAAVLTASIDSVAERHLRHAGTAAAVRVVIFHLNAVVFMDALHL